MYKMIKLTIFSLLLISLSSEALTFSQAKTKLKSIYKNQPESFYCGCDIKWESKKKLVPVTEGCGYKPRNEFTKKGKINKRAQRIEWEHVVPAWEFGHQLQCWQKGKRKYCAKSSEVFKNMEGDLHNLVPAIGEVNADRSNFKYGLIDKEERVYGQCDAEVNFKGRTFEPMLKVRGNIARTYFYFEKQYGLKISKKQKQLYTAWDKLDPVDADECKIHLEKSKIQGNENPYVASQCN
jgi:deoxyribonuclease-1